jgi:hypothetical protein
LGVACSRLLGDTSNWILGDNTLCWLAGTFDRLLVIGSSPPLERRRTLFKKGALSSGVLRAAPVGSALGLSSIFGCTLIFFLR